MDLLFFLPLALLGVLVLVSLFYQYRIWLPALRKQPDVVNQSEQGVSIILAARNQAAFLKEHLPIWLSQNHTLFELVVVNDCSYDETADLLMEWQAKDTRLRVVTLEEQPKYPTGKKFALTLGVKAANYELLLFTDADAVPASADWITTMQKYYVNKTELVLGLAFPKPTKGLLNLLSRYDAVYTALQYTGHALGRRAYMGVGKNLSYLKSLFFFHKGFVAHIKHVPGDDDLFVNGASSAHNVRVALDPKAFVEVSPEKSFGQFWKKKIRLLSSFRYYRESDRRWLLTLLLVQWLLPLFAAVNVWWYLAQPTWLYVGMGIFALGWVHRLVFTGIFMRRTKQTSLMIWLPFIQPIHQLLQLFWTLRGYWAKPGW